MALGIGDNFSYQGKKPNFERDSFKTKNAMKSFPESSIDDGHIAYCEEDGKHYEYKSNNPVDSATGKWKLYLGDYALSSDVNTQIKAVDDKLKNAATKQELETKLADYSTSTEVDNKISDYVTEYNVSKLHPTSGIGGSNKFTLAEAIKLIPKKHQTVGIKCSFLENSGKVKVWRWTDTDIAQFTNAASWVEVVDGSIAVSEVESAKTNALNAIGIKEQNAIGNFSAQRVTPEMLSPATKQYIDAAGGGTITNLPDDEDLTTVNGVLKIKDKQHDAASFSGKGRRILRKNIVMGKNVLSQDMVNEPNTIYVIGYDYDLEAKTILIPYGVTLKFEGGSLKNGTLDGDFSIINESNQKCFEGIEFSGNCRNLEINIDWFVSKYNKSMEFNGVDSSVEIQDAFNSKARRFRINNDRYYYIANTITVMSWQSIYGVRQTEVVNRSTKEAFPCLYTDKDIVVVDIVAESDNETKRINSIYVDNLYVRRHGTFTIEDFKINIPLVYVSNGTTAHNSCWGVYLNIFLYSNDIPINLSYNGQSFKDIYFNGYTGLEIEAKNNGYFTYIKLYGNIYGFRRAFNIHTNNNFKDSWITDLELYANTKASYGGILNASPLRLHGSHQPECQLLPNDTIYYFESNGEGVSDAMIWDLGNKHGKCEYITTTKKPFLSKYGIEDLTNVVKSDCEQVVLPIDRWKISLQDYSSYIACKANIFESIFLNLQGAHITNNKSFGHNGSVDKGKGVVNSIKLYADDGEFVDLNSNNLFNYNKLFKLSGIQDNLVGDTNLFNGDDVVINKDIPLKYYKYELSIEVGKAYISRLNRAYICMYANDTVDIKVYAVSNNDLLLSKNISKEILKSSGLFFIPIREQIYNKYEALRFVFKTDINKNEQNGRILPKIGLVTHVSDNVITSSGGEIVGRLVMNDTVWYNKSKNLYFKYYCNEFINLFFNSLNKKAFKPVLCFGTLYNSDYEVNILYITEYGENSLIYHRNKIMCNDQNLKFKLSVDKSAYVHKLLLSVSGCSYFKIVQVLSTQASVFYDINSPGNYTEDVNYVPRLKSGSFVEKPIDDEIGAEYFCIDKQTTEGAANGIMIYHKGNNVWVDALGREVQ